MPSANADHMSRTERFFILIDFLRTRKLPFTAVQMAAELGSSDRIYRDIETLAGGGNEGKLAVYPGGLHGFDALGGEIDAVRTRIGKFLGLSVNSSNV